MPPTEYRAVVYLWPLADLYVWLLAKHVAHFDDMINQAVADVKRKMGTN